MSNHISEEGPRQGHAAGDTSVEQQASQLASDIKYKARQKMKQTSGSSLSPAQVQALYRQLLNASPAPGAVKSIVKKKLFEKVDRGVELVSETIKGSKSSVFGKIFVEGGGQKEEVIEEDSDQKFVIRVTDKATGNTSYRKGDRAKIAQLRANPNISSVEITGRKKADDAYDSEKSGGKKAKKDYDGDGKIESGTAEYMGSRDKAIKKAMAKEEVIYEKEENSDKKIDVMKGKNTVKVNPSLGESIKAELAALSAEKIQEQEAVMKQQEDEKKKEAAALQQAKKDKMMKLRILQNKMKAVRGGTEINASHEMQGDTVAEGEKEKKDDEDPRSMGTKVRLARNKLRSMGLKMSYDMEGEMTEATYPSDFKKGSPVATKKTGRPVQHDQPMSGGRRKTVDESSEDSLRDRRMERGGVDGNTRYDRAPKAPNTKKFGTGKTAVQKELEKKHGKGASAMDIVKAEIRAKHGKGAIKD
jgi:hypothetical protein